MAVSVGAVALFRSAIEANERDLCAEHPAFLLDHVKCVDATSGEQFEFQLVNETDPWYWQRAVLDDWLREPRSINLKARQLGITWLAAGLGLWQVLYRPGTRVLIISINEAEAAKVVNRLWDMLESLPEHLRNGVTVLKPARGVRPNLHIELQHPDGQVSYVTGLPSTRNAGRGETAAIVIFDEFAFHEYAQESWQALIPTTSSGGKLIAISTGNGVSSTSPHGVTTGNFFHSLWVTGDETGLSKRFLRWDLHPDRDERWYQDVAMAIPSPSQRAAEFPATELEAFILTGSPYLDVDALAWYRQNALREPAYRMRFEKATFDTARRVTDTNGWTRVFTEPQADHDYALYADVATGRGADYSAAYVLDLAEMAVCAAFHGKLDSDQYAYQLHYLGRWYRTAWLAVEMGGGYGEPVVLSLRDGREGRPAYPRLYRHRQLDRGDQPQSKPFGFPINSKTRPTLCEGLAEAIRDRALPFLDAETMAELMTFVRRSKLPSPAAMEGCHDDRVMALAGVLELYRQRGHHEGREQRRSRRRKRDVLPAYPWQQPPVNTDFDDDRYRPAA